MTSLEIVILLSQVFGGLALFLLGMKFMGDGLNKAAGEKMKRVLAICTGNRFSAIAAGTGVTIAMQSSSATTVMTIGFVNAGLITLTQAIGVIFGANIGTTVTAQIIAFKVSWIAMPAIALGFGMTFIPWRKMHGWGDSVLGFGFIFYGMKLMSDTLEGLGKHQDFIALFNTFNCAPEAGTAFPAIGALVGAIGEIGRAHV